VNATGAEPQALGLPEAIALGRRALSDLTCPPPFLSSGGLERVLSVAAARHHIPGDRPSSEAPHPLESAAVALRTACAHLGAGDLPSAHLALRVAHDALAGDSLDTARAEQHAGPQATPPRRTPMDRRAEEVADIQRRALRDRTRLDQAVGMLAQVGGTSVSRARLLLREHAEHHRFVLTELAADIVAGRVDPTVVTASPRSRNPRAQEKVPHRPR